MASSVVCHKCGHPGFSVALIFCDDCQKVAQHRYWLDVIPETFTEYVTWYCEDCKPKHPSKDEVEADCSLSSTRSAHSSQSSQEETPRSDTTLASSSMYSSSLDGISISFACHETCRSGGGRCLQNSAPDQTHTDGAMDIDDPKESTVEPSKLNTDHTMLATSTSQVFDQNAFVPSLPIYKPIWRGCFKISVGKFGIVDGLAAHLSTKASIQVYEEAKLLSESLCPEFLPRPNIWPKCFIESGPNDDNIALYFLPQKESYEKNYAVLVDHMIEHDLAMRAGGENADLLIFTSMELPLNFWRFQDKCYIWGVFKGKKASSGSGTRKRNQKRKC